MSFAKSFMKKIKDDFTSLVVDGEGSAECTGYLDTGCLAFNALLSGSIYGGLPNNRIGVLAGDPATGKTFLVLGVMDEHLKAHPDSVVVLFESESAIDRETCESRGLDSSRIIRKEPLTIEEFRNPGH
jgi:RecA/RadA recombinase